MIPSLFFCCSIQHAHDLAAVLRGHGVRVYPISGKTHPDERRRLVRLARAGEIDGLSSCDAISVGFDSPISMAALMVKPSKSGLWYRQAIGRVIRPYPAPQGRRAYQEECLDKIAAAARRGVRNGLIVKPTGTGKTRIAAQLPQRLYTTRPRLIFLVHRDELADQSADTFAAMNPALRVGIEKAGSHADQADIVIGSIQTMGLESTGRLAGFRPEQFYCVCTDEAHIAPRSKYHYACYQHFRCLKGAPDRDPEILHLGFTATPTGRHDGVGLECLYDEIVYSLDIRDAIRDGWLADITAYRAETSVDISKVASHHDDFAAKPLELTVNNRERNELVAQKYLEICRLEGMDGPLSNIGQKRHAIVVDFVDIAGKHSLVVAATLFGLRSKWNPEGKSLTQQIEQIELLEKQNPGIDLRSAANMEALHATLRRIDLLAAPEVPPEIAAVSPYGWLLEGADSYRLAIMDSTTLLVRGNTLGLWEVYESNLGVTVPVGFERSLKDAIRLAEEQIPAGKRMVLRATAKWQSKAPSESQMFLIWKRDHKVKSEFPNSEEWFEFCQERYRSGEDSFSRGGLSKRLSMLMG